MCDVANDSLDPQSASQSTTCPVCLEELTNRIVTRIPCSHELCLHCFSLLLSKVCPMCRFDFRGLLPVHERTQHSSLLPPRIALEIQTENRSLSLPNISSARLLGDADEVSHVASEIVDQLLQSRPNHNSSPHL